MDSSTHNWILPGKQAWVRHEELFKVCTIASRDQAKKSAGCKLTGIDQTINVPFTDIYEHSHTQNEYPDMCSMDVLNEPEILSNIRRRYSSDKIFTKIGPTLIVVNPYKTIDALFNHDKMKQLTSKVKKSEKIDNLDPHVFLIAGNAYNKLRIGNRKQAIVISGESGAGKTENAKYCMTFLAALSHTHHEDQKVLAVQDKILDCNPVLQAFGNSKTVRNSNSSRFGKYVRIYLDGMCSIKGAKIESYLLQKSRVVSVAPQQRNFHVFYCLSNSPVKNKYGLLENEKYNFLEQSGCHVAQGINDKQNFTEVDSALQKVGFSNDEITRIWKTVASILILGNIEYDDTMYAKDVNNSCTFQDKSLADRAMQLLGINNIEKVLLEQKKKHGKEEIVSKFSKAQCIGNRNTLVKALYNRVFDYLIEKMNDRLSVKQEKFSSIGLLDIFGFQNFEVNSFEQLCINFTNEKLQKLYTRYVFQTELDEIKKDGLGDRVKDITPPDNRLVIQLIEKPRGPGVSIFSLVDDKTSLIQAKDQDIVSDLKKEFCDPKKNPNKHIQTALTSKNTFTIIHTQANVTYSIEGFKMKNQDTVTAQIDGVLDKLFPLQQNQDKKGKTIITKFDVEVKVLMEELEGSQVHFIRCIKPNELKIKEHLDDGYTLKQIRYLGVLETIKIRKSTFPFRKPFKQFNQVYGQLITADPKFTKESDKTKDILVKIFPQIDKQKNVYLIGTERIYLSSQYEAKLNNIMLEKFKKKQESAIKIQRQYRAWKFRRSALVALKKIVTKLRKLKGIVFKKLLKTKKLYLTQFRAQAAKATEVFKERKKQQEKKRQKQKEQKERLAKESARAADRQKRIKRIESGLPKLVKAFNKFQKFLFFNKLKYHKKQQILNETIILNETMLNYETVVLGESLQQEPSFQKKVPQKPKISQMQFNQSFLDQKSILEAPSDSIALKGQIRVPKFTKHPGLQKLRDIVQEVYQSDTVNDDQYYSPSSKDCTFDINSIPNQTLNKIVNFDYVSFFDSTLRVRTTLFGRKKSCLETLVAKDAPITKSLILLSVDEEKKAVECFKLTLRLSEEQKIQRVFKLVEQILEMLQETSQTLKNEIFTQFLKQQNTKSQLSAIRIYQLMTIFLHVFRPDDSFIYAALNIFYSKLTSPNHKKQSEYLQYLFPRLLKFIEPGFEQNVIYLPAQYQMMALMCKRQISMPVFLSVGNSVILRVESTQTFQDIKMLVMQEVGINHHRLNKDLFSFFQVMNFENEELQQSPIDDSRNVWDLLTYWERAKDKIEESHVKPPIFIMMFKVRYAYECDCTDQESIEIFYAQCYFDLFIGRIKLEIKDLACAVAALRLININNPDVDPATLIPMWAVNKFKAEEVSSRIAQYEKEIAKEKLTKVQLKFRFVKLCDSSKLCMAMSIPTEQQVQLFLRPKRIIFAEKGIIHEEISIKKILKWSVDDQTLMLCIMKDNDSKTIVIRTQHAQIVSKYLTLSAKLIMKKIE